MPVGSGSPSRAGVPGRQGDDVEYEQIAYEVRGPAAVVTLSRPDQLNAFTPRMAAELMDVFDRTDADDDVRGVVVTGAGRAFCAGADLSAGATTFDLGSFEERAAARPSDGASGPGGGPSSWGMVGEGDQRAPADLGGHVVLRIHRSTSR